MYIIFDTETTGLPKNWKLPYTATDNWPRCVQIAWQLHDKNGTLIETKDFLVYPDGYDIPFDSERIHGISTLLAQKEGVPLQEVLKEFNEALDKSEFIVGQNIGFDINVMGAEFIRAHIETPMHDMPILDTCTETTAQLCQLPGGRGGKFKLPTLTELHKFLFQHPFGEAHNATADVEATTRCFFELVRRRIFTSQELHENESYLDEFNKFNQRPIEPVGLDHENLKEKSRQLKEEYDTQPSVSKTEIKEGLKKLEDIPFVHLHNHTQFSILQASSTLNDLIAKAAKYNMPALALTDTGNMMAAFHFEKFVTAHNTKIRAQRKAAEEKGEEFQAQEITPIIGCEFNICEDHTNKTVKDNGYRVVILAKNKKGYHNLSKMSSIAFTKGKYYVPRIDKKIVEEYKDDLIVLSGNLMGEIPSKILNIGEKQAEEALIWWKEQFGDDFYLEIMRHNQEDERRVNQTLIKFSKKHKIKLVASNNTYYIEQKDSHSHDILLCIKEGEMVDTPIGRGRGFRNGLPNNDYYFKSPKAMKELFADIPEAIETTIEIANKCEHYGLANDILLPAFEIPEKFRDEKDKEDNGKRGENNYLRYLTYEGAKERYPDLTDEIKERLDFELSIIEKTGYPGYFLIVQDFCKAAREMGVIVGPGRGSAAGSAVAYCNFITKIDPIQYDLLFERFLNPDRVSMPDIDIDFDDEGRTKIINWVIEKYGENQVAQIITWGTMAAKSSVRDVSRVLNLPLMEAGILAKLIPDNVSLNELLTASDEELNELLKDNKEDIELAKQLIQKKNGNDLEAKVLDSAIQVEGSIRNTGIHACGVIITPSDITEFVPVALAKDSNMYCTQYDNSVVEEAGLLKMDFLGLKTLTLIKDAFALIKEKHPDFTLTPDEIPIDDEKTYALFQRGETVGIFQYESPGMQKHLRALRPTEFADLIAMNALYRPGPMEYIPSFIKRKHKEEEIVYDDADMEEYLKETYGITVYQEQVMLLSQKLAGFTKGEADTLRKAMGKKKISLLEKLKPKFLDQGEERGHKRKILEKIWGDWEKFASYAFNKSHSTCYAWLGYQTAYLKANYPAQYMASVLSNNMNNIKSVSFFMEECKRMGLSVLGPDINESSFKFTVNPEGAIRFGLGGIKGVGSGPVETIMEEREKNGFFKHIFDVTKRVDLRRCNKKALEGLILAGAVDSFPDAHRAQYFEEEKTVSFLSKVIKFGRQYQENLDTNQASLFGGESGVEIPSPTIPAAKEWSLLQKLNKEKEVVGIYISGHPLDDFRTDIDSFCSGTVSMVKKPLENKNRSITFAGIITEVEHRISKKGNPFGIISIEDYYDETKLYLFGTDYGRYKDYMVNLSFVYINGKFKPDKYDPNKYRFQIQEIDYLTNLRNKKIICLELKIELNQLDQDLIDSMQQLFKNFEGKSELNFNVYDPVNNIQVHLPSRAQRINISDELLNELKQQKIEFKLL